MEFPIVTTDSLFVDLLNRTRKIPVSMKAGTEAFDKQDEEFSDYRVETYGLAVIYTAIPLERDNGVLPTKYGVIAVEYEACNSCFFPL